VPPGEEEVLIVRGLAPAPHLTNRLTGRQAALLRAIVHAKLGLDVDVHALEPVEPDVFAGAQARRDRLRRTRLVQHTMSPGASEAGAMTAKPCDPTATAQEEGR
jgi:hypothetical protein